MEWKRGNGGTIKWFGKGNFEIGKSSTGPILSSVASNRAVAMYSENKATSGTSVGLYQKNTVSGIGGSGVSARLYSYANVAAALVVGAQITGEIGVSGTISGLCTGARSQLSLPDDHAAFTQGTYCGGQSEIYFNGDNSSTTDLSGAAAHAIHRFILDGDTTARAKVRNLFEIVNISTGTSDVTKMLNTANITASHGLNILINGEPYSLLVDKQ